jgi:hypothetical protein
METDWLHNMFLILCATGILWWGWFIMKIIDHIGITYASRRGKEYYSTLEGKTYDFRVKWPKETINDIASRSTEICTRCKPKPKWERTNAEETDDDDSESI